ncbi:RICIN domain-containing protein [Bacillus cereus]|nr:RICIN domain-containing protein [Bacillus cereus]MEB9434362.1 RICIN domain-containing protein [Bacillus cereus]MEB9483518.1 RICIN domain-containing protein [Bacillus cereus]
MNTINELNKEKNTITRLIITSDPQYPWTPAMDDGNSKESENEKKRVSENLIREQYNNINSYVSSHGVAPVIINGDITAYGHPWQREKMEELFNELLMRHFYGLGNHDIENNFNNCVDNRCTAGSLSDLYWHTRRMPETILDEVDIKKSDLPFGKTALTGSFAYAINHQDFYIIQLNNYPTMEIESKPVFGDHFKMQSTLDWLEKVLKKARALGKIIIVNVHKPDCWTVKPKCKDEKPSQRFKDLLKKYDVSAVFAGHYHKKLGLRGEFSEYFGNIPVFLSGSASQKSYLIVEQTEENLNVYSVQENNWRGKKLEKSIKLNLPIKGTYKIKTALNNTRSGVDVSVNRNPDGDRNVHLYKDNDTKRHQWDFYYDSVRNAYQIHSVEERSKVLAWNDFNKSKNVFLTNNKKLDEHYWFLEDIGNDYYIIKNYKDSSLVLEVEGGKTDDNTNIHVNIRRETNAQKFKLKPAIIQGTYKIKTALNGTSGVDVSVNRNPDGDRNVHLYKDNDTKRHQWDFYYDSIRNAYQIHNVEERSKVLAWNDFNKSKNVFLTNNKKLDEHYWFIEDIGNDYYIIKNYKDSSLVLEVEGGKTGDNTNIHVNKRSEANAQKFKLVKIESKSFYYQQDLSEQESENTLLLNS